jgi:hypothetical protein
MGDVMTVTTEGGPKEEYCTLRIDVDMLLKFYRRIIEVWRFGDCLMRLR